MGKKQIGRLLVEAGIITAKTLERVLRIQRVSGKRLGELLREMGIVTEEEITIALANQFNLKTVKNLADYSFSKDLLDLVPTQMALEKMVFPLKQYENTLALATFDPFDHETFAAIYAKTGMQIYLVLATRQDILAAIDKHYRIRGQVESYKQKILLIDDSALFTKILKTALSKEGYEVLVAGDGIEGLNMAISHHPDLILCDLFMPRLDGYKFLLALNEYQEIAAIPVILATSKASIEEESQALKAGFIDFIGKPVLPAVVVARVQRALATIKLQIVRDNLVSKELQPTTSATKATTRLSNQQREHRNHPKAKANGF